MILTCPSCATRYFTPPNALGEDGRTVKCASCGHKWLAKPEQSVDEDEDFLTEEETQTSLAETVEEIEAAPKPAPNVRRDVQDRRITLARKQAWTIWGGAAAALVLVFAGSFLFRNDVVAIWPKTASLYGLFGLEATTRGLVFGDVTAERLNQASGPVLSLTTSVTNITGNKRLIPFVRVSMHDGEAREVAAWIIALDTAVLEKRGQVNLTASIPAPPANAAGIRLEFVDEPDLATPIVYGRSEQVSPI